eukprot:5005899-Amphidinium_carterae.1
MDARDAMKGEGLVAEILEEVYRESARSKLPSIPRGKLTAKGSSKTDGRTIFTKIEPGTEDGSFGKDGRKIFTKAVRFVSEHIAERSGLLKEDTKARGEPWRLRLRVREPPRPRGALGVANLVEH